MRCFEITKNGQCLAVAGSEAAPILDAGCHFDTVLGVGRFHVAGLLKPKQDTSELVIWADGDLKVGDELILRVVESEAPDRGRTDAVYGKGAAPDDAKLSCSFCGKSKAEAKHLVAGPAVCICDDCVRESQDIISKLDNGDAQK
jgi:hypothetical protein